MVEVNPEPLNLPPYHVYTASVLSSIMGAFRDNDDKSARVMMLKQINMACNMAKLIQRQFDGNKFTRAYSYMNSTKEEWITETKLNNLSVDDLWDMMNYFNYRAGLTAKQEAQVPISLFDIAREQVGR